MHRGPQAHCLAQPCCFGMPSVCFGRTSNRVGTLQDYASAMMQDKQAAAQAVAEVAAKAAADKVAKAAARTNFTALGQDPWQAGKFAPTRNTSEAHGQVTSQRPASGTVADTTASEDLKRAQVLSDLQFWSLLCINRWCPAAFDLGWPHENKPKRSFSPRLSLLATHLANGNSECLGQQTAWHGF